MKSTYNALEYNKLVSFIWLLADDMDKAKKGGLYHEKIANTRKDYLHKYHMGLHKEWPSK